MENPFADASGEVVTLRRRGSEYAPASSGPEEE